MTTNELVPPAAPQLSQKPSQCQLIYTHKGVTLPLLEMTDPYYPHSKLAKSIFSGYYILFFMYSVLFMVTYPLLNFLQGEDLFGITVIKLVETNILWDCISAVLFIMIAMVMTKIDDFAGQLQEKRGNKGGMGVRVMMAIVGLVFGISGLWIVRSSKMYFTDRIFIVVLNWALCAKTLSYIYDKNQQRKKTKQSLVWTQIQKQKQRNLNKISKRLLYLISPLPIYHKFVLEHNPKLKIHIKYLITKFFVSFLCLFVNNILIVKFIQPACREQNLSFIALVFKLIPLTFYINMTLYYMVMDNIIAALAQITSIQTRLFYYDWWNAQTLHQFLDRWCLILNMTTQSLCPSLSLRTRHTLHVAMLQILLLCIFGQSISLIACLEFIGVCGVVWFLGGRQGIQNNMLVHVLCMTYTPVVIALQVKFGIFSLGVWD